MNAVLHLHAFVLQGSTDTLRGTLLADDIDTAEWGTATAVINQQVAINTVSVVAGDRIVLEVGYQAQNTSATSFTGTIRYGGTSATDLSATPGSTTGVTTDSPWVDFSDDTGVLRAGVALSPTTPPADTAAATDTLVALSRTTTGADTAAATDSARATVTKTAADVAAATDSPPTWVAQRQRAVADTALVLDNVVAVLTHSEIQDRQFVLGEGLTDVSYPWIPFGFGQAIVVEKFDPGAAEDRTQDVLSPVADVRYFGTDRKTPPTWGFNLYTNVESESEALGWADDFEAVWDREDLRSTPGAVVPLRYSLGGRIRRVYGRPGNFAAVDSPTLRTGRLDIVCDFRLSENTFYDDNLQGVSLGMRPSARAGLTFPITFPISFQTEGAPRQETMVIGGSRPTWIDVLFYGASVDPWILISGGPKNVAYRWGLRGEVALGQTVRMSGKPWQQGLLRSDGAWVPGMLDPRARLSQLRLYPGTYTVLLGGYGSSSTAKADVSWRNAYGSM
jgi:hypothetical protein